jgi:MOSC domain-containing protein YiiM
MSVESSRMRTARPVPFARVMSLQLHERRCEPPRSVEAVRGTRGGGLVGDSHAERTKRAVLVVDRATLDDLELRPGDLREQITLEGLPAVNDLAPGTRLRVGSIELVVNAPCEPCTHIGAMLAVPDPEALRSSLEGRRGVLCTVVDEGIARVGDDVEVLD